MSFLNKRIQFQRLRKNGRKPSNYPTDSAGIPLRITQMLSFKLPEITPESIELSKREKDVVCINEMMTLFDCFQKHEFDKTFCEKQAMALENCYSNFMTRRQKRKSATHHS